MPASPGVYLFKDESGTVLYVGKAASLHHRVASYFRPRDGLPPRLQKMLGLVRDIDFFLTDSEQEALILECNLIKQHQPAYNVRLKDGKTYPYLKISLNEDWPRVYVTRRVERDGARYFGPFASARSVRSTLSMLRRMFPFRSCRNQVDGKAERPCLEYHIHRCLGPCISAVTRDEYRQMIEQVILFLEGKQEAVARRLRANMERAAARLEFERAAVIRDQLQAVESVTERQKTAAAEGDADVIAFAEAADQAYAVVFQVRNGKLLAKEHFVLAGTHEQPAPEIMAGFLKQFYAAASHIPREILLQHPVEDAALLRRWLEDLRGGRVELKTPRRGVKKELVDMVAENARRGLEQARIKLLAQPALLATALEELQQCLLLPRFPRRVECYDVSNIQGKNAVGAMVVFEGGVPRKSDYRRFRIRAGDSPNDYAMIQEVLRRRLARGSGRAEDSSWARLPDLVLIDGGRGQLNAALEVVREVADDPVACASIAKENEAVFVPQLADPVMLPRDSAALHLLQRIRDEAHRFAIGYYRKVHRRGSIASELDGVPGIGPKRRRALLRAFGSMKGVRGAPVEAIAAVKGMNRELAQRLKDRL